LDIKKLSENFMSRFKAPDNNGLKALNGLKGALDAVAQGAAKHKRVLLTVSGAVVGVLLMVCVALSIVNRPYAAVSEAKVSAAARDTLSQFMFPEPDLPYSKPVPYRDPSAPLSAADRERYWQRVGPEDISQAEAQAEKAIDAFFAGVR
jgi:hypothetical protein